MAITGCVILSVLGIDALKLDQVFACLPQCRDRLGIFSPSSAVEASQ
jgi:hypothetical protein